MASTLGNDYIPSVNRVDPKCHQWPFLDSIGNRCKGQALRSTTLNVTDVSGHLTLV